MQYKPALTKYRLGRKLRNLGTLLLGGRVSFFRNAPAAIAVAAAQYQSPVDEAIAARENADPQVRQIRQWRNIADSRIQSVASAIAYLLLILHQMGMGAVWMTGPIKLRKILKKSSKCLLGWIL